MEYVRFSARGVRPATVARLRNLAHANRTVVGAILDDAVGLLWEMSEEISDEVDMDEAA